MVFNWVNLTEHIDVHHLQASARIWIVAAVARANRPECMWNTRKLVGFKGSVIETALKWSWYEKCALNLKNDLLGDSIRMSRMFAIQQ